MDVTRFLSKRLQCSCLPAMCGGAALPPSHLEIGMLHLVLIPGGFMYLKWHFIITHWSCLYYGVCMYSHIFFIFLMFTSVNLFFTWIFLHFAHFPVQLLVFSYRFINSLCVTDIYSLLNLNPAKPIAEYLVYLLTSCVVYFAVLVSP